MGKKRINSTSKNTEMKILDLWGYGGSEKLERKWHNLDNEKLTMKLFSVVVEC